MTTNNRMSRFDQDLLSVAQLSGSIVNNYLIDNGSIRSRVGSNNPNQSLTSFVVKFDIFSNDKISEIYNTEFSEFVEEVLDEQSNIFDREQVDFLQKRLQEVTVELDNLRQIDTVEDTVEDAVIVSQPTQSIDVVLNNTTSFVMTQDSEVIGDLSDVELPEIVPETIMVTENTIILNAATEVESINITYDNNNNIITPTENVSPSQSIKDTSMKSNGRIVEDADFTLLKEKLIKIR